MTETAFKSATELTRMLREKRIRSQDLLEYYVERIERLKASDRWKEGDSPLGLAKVRVYKLAMKKKKKKKAEEEGEGEGEGDEAAKKD